MLEETINPVSAIRSVKRSDLKEVRYKHKQLLLYNKRLGLKDVSDYVHDVTLSEFSELLLKLKKKPVPLELLKKIKNSCINSDYIEAVFRNEGAFNSLVRILIGNDAQKQLEAAACLTNLTCGPHKCSHKVAKAAGVYLISFINGSSCFLQDQSIWALANIANDCLECFEVIKSQGVLPALLKAFVSPSLNVLQSIAFALYACTQYEDTDIVSVIQKDLPECLLTLIEQENINKSVFLDAAFAFSNCCFLSIKYSLNIFDTKSVERVINILSKIIQNSEKDIMIAMPVLRSIGFLSYDDKMSEYIASHDDFYRSIQIISSDENHIHLIKEAIWVLSNVTASTNIICDSFDLMSLIDNLKMTLKKENSVTLQVLYYLSILISKNKLMSFQLLEHEIFVEIKSLLECEEKDISEASRIFLDVVQQ